MFFIVCCVVYKFTCPDDLDSRQPVYWWNGTATHNSL